MTKKLLISVVLLTLSFNLSIAQFITKIDEGNRKHIIVGNDTSYVNWTTQYIEAKGWSVMDTSRFKIPGQAMAMARIGAITDAQRNLLERIKGVRIVGGTIVEDMVTKKDYIYKKLDEVIKGAEQVGSETVNGMLVEVRMRVPIYKNKNGFAHIVQEAMDVKTEKQNDDIDLNDDNQQVVFNMNGHKFDPVLFPKIVDEHNNVLLDYSKTYNAETGKFPKFLNIAKNVFEATGFEKGATVVNVIEAVNGILKVETDKPRKRRINWKKIGKIAGTIGGALLMLL